MILPIHVATEIFVIEINYYLILILQKLTIKTKLIITSPT